MNKSLIILLIAAALGIGVILVSVQDSSSYESFEIAEKNPGQEFHVVGELVQHEKMVYDPIIDPNHFEFYLKDQDGRTCKVVYPNIKPNDLERSEQVVIIGSMNEDSNLFYASSILTKCPSKYVEDDIEVVNS